MPIPIYYLHISKLSESYHSGKLFRGKLLFDEICAEFVEFLFRLSYHLLTWAGREAAGEVMLKKKSL